MNNFNNVYMKRNDGKMIYKIYKMQESSNNCIIVFIELVKGWDYIAPDTNNIQGWCNPENFIEDVQTDFFTFYPLDENLTNCIIDNGYQVIKYTQN